MTRIYFSFSTLALINQGKQIVGFRSYCTAIQWEWIILSLLQPIFRQFPEKKTDFFIKFVDESQRHCINAPWRGYDFFFPVTHEGWT